MNALRPENRVIVTDVALVVDLHENVPVASFEEPVRHRVHRTLHRSLVLEAFILAEVEVAEDDHHPQLVRPVEHLLQPGEVIRS